MKQQTAALPPLPDIAGDELGFFTQLGAAVKADAIKPVDEALFAQFARIGLSRDGFDASKLDPARRKGLARALNDGPSVAISAFQSAAVQRNGWSWATRLDDFGFDYPLRALVSGPYLGGQGEKEAMYPLRHRCRRQGADRLGRRGARFRCRRIFGSTGSIRCRFDRVAPKVAPAG